jgi:hypothetical protein
VSHCHLNLNVLLKICSRTPDLNLAGKKFTASYVGRSLIRPLTPPPPRSSTPPSLFPAADAFDNVPQGFDAGWIPPASEAFKDVSQDHGKSFIPMNV